LIKRLILLGALALACGAGIRLSNNPSVGTAVMPSRAAVAPLIELGDGRPRWEPLWTRPAPDLSHASVSPDGDAVAWVDGKGSVRRLDAVTGRTLWQTESLSGMTQILAVPGGDVLAYAPLNRLQATVRVLDRAYGSKKGAVYPIDGAVWSVTVANGGSAAFIGTGKGSIYTLPIRRMPKDPYLRPTVWTADGIPESMSATEDGSLTLISHWGMNGIGAWHPTKPTLLTTASVPASPLWLKPEKEAPRDLRLSLSDNGKTALALSRHGARGQDAHLDVLDAATGNRLWQIDLDASGAKAQVSSDGQFIAVTCAHMSDYNTGSVLEHKLSYYTRDGHKVFGDRGGLYFSPELVAVSTDGSRITVQSGPSTLFTLDKRGNFKSKLTLPKNEATNVSPTIRECIPTHDGRFLLVVRGDGQITFYKAIAS
jgi:outer membrane protein assembly factor BamB